MRNGSVATALLNVASVSTSSVPCIITPFSGQASNVLEIQDSSGTPKTFITANNLTGGEWAQCVAQGRLSYSATDGNIATNQSAQTTLYYTPFNGRHVTLWNPTYSCFENIPFDITQPSLSLGALSANTNYDIFLNSTGSVITPALSAVAWASSTTRTTALTYDTVPGYIYKTGSKSFRYIGTIRTVAAGQGEDSQSKRFLYNEYNKIFRFLRVSFSGVGSSWAFSNGTSSGVLIQQPVYFSVNNTPTNLRLEYLVGGINPSGNYHLWYMSFFSVTASTNGYIGVASDYAGVTITNVALTSNVATITTSIAHGLPATGFNVSIYGLTNTFFNGTYTVTGIPTSTTFTFALTHANVASVADSGSMYSATTNTNILGPFTGYVFSNSTDIIPATVSFSGQSGAIGYHTLTGHETIYCGSSGATMTIYPAVSMGADFLM